EYALTRSLRNRFDEQRKRQGHAREVGDALDDPKRRGRYAAIREDLFGAPLMQRQRERERVGARVRNVQVLAQRGDVRLAAGTVQPLRHVEHDVGTCERKLLRKEFVGFETDDVAEKTQRL